MSCLFLGAAVRKALGNLLVSPGEVQDGPGPDPLYYRQVVQDLGVDRGRHGH